MGDLDRILARLIRVARSGRPLALLFDYDGTLAPICRTPDEAVLPPSVLRSLARLAARPNVAVGVLSGRALTDLQNMVELDTVYLAGTSGLEIDLLGKRLTPPGIETARAPLDQLAGRLTDVADRYPGAWVEQKPFGLTLHYRAVAAKWGSRLRLDAAEAVGPWVDKVRVEDVTLGLEVVPEVGWHKGTAVRAILSDLGGDVFPVYAGDSANDAPALAAVDRAGGLSIGVGPLVQTAAMGLRGSGIVGSLIILLANVLPEWGGTAAKLRAVIPA